MKKEDDSLESREVIKKGKMEYLYETEGKEFAWPIYGSLLRALGKGWSVGFVTDDVDVFQKMERLKGMLVDNERFLLLSVSDFFKQNMLQRDLWLGLGLRGESLRVGEKVLGQSHLMISGGERCDSFDLISKFEMKSRDDAGLLAITGDGKGKTTSALGKALEGILDGERVAVVQWFKEFKGGAYTWAINEHFFSEKLVIPEAMKFFPTGLGFYGSPNLDRVRGEEAYSMHRSKAYEGMDLARRLILSGEYNKVVLDELVDTVKEIAWNIEYPLIDLKDMRNFLEFCVLQKEVEITVTGRRVTEDWEEFVGESLVITEVKHPWSSSGRGAVSGLDF